MTATLDSEIILIKKVIGESITTKIIAFFLPLKWLL